MTRVNAHIPPYVLSDQHLMAEHREIVRLAKQSHTYWTWSKREPLPESFRMGTGHVRYFFDKIDYIADRYTLLYEECLARGFNVQDYSEAFANPHPNAVGNYKPNAETIKTTQSIIFARLFDRLLGSKVPVRYMGEVVEPNRLISAMAMAIGVDLDPNMPVNPNPEK